VAARVSLPKPRIDQPRITDRQGSERARQLAEKVARQSISVAQLAFIRGFGDLGVSVSLAFASALLDHGIHGGQPLPRFGRGGLVRQDGGAALSCGRPE